MNFSLEKNAMSSLNIAIEHFKEFYYRGNNYSNSKFDENIKITIIFLENAVELFLKRLLIKKDRFCIYGDKAKQKIEKILKKTKENCNLEKVLMRENDIFTIGYSQTVSEYIKKYSSSNRTKCILNELAIMRNKLTHYGIEITEKEYVGIYSVLINTFDVIYNELFEELSKLDEVGYFFTEDDFIGVETIHGYKPLFSSDGLYNNILDFLDELLEIAPSHICYLKYIDNENYMNVFIKQLNEFFINNSSICNDTYKYSIKCDVLDEFNKLDIIIDLYDENSKKEIQLFSRYSICCDKLYFTDEDGLIYFCYDNIEKKIFIYNDMSIYEYPEIENQIKKDFENSLCTRRKLNSESIKQAIINTIKLGEKYYG